MAKVRFARTTDWHAGSRVLFFGGNGHSASRLVPARAALARLVGANRAKPMDLVEIEFPGFEGRAPAASWEEFVSACAAQVAELTTPATVLYGTGIGGLVILALRARDAAPVPAVLQAPVLWGLEARRFPLWMRFPAAGAMVRAAFRVPPIQWWFSRKYFTVPVPRDARRGFFRGYARCRGFARMFSWLAPPLLRSLEESLRGRPEKLERISCWWGGKDRVVTTAELRATEAALGVKWPLREFADWGHYPMIDAPEAWIAEILRAASAPH